MSDSSQVISSGASSVPKSGPKKRKRGPNTLLNQKECFVDFVLEHRDALDVLSGNYDSLWSNLTEKLNAMGPPERDIADWQENLKNWEYQIKHKDRVLKSSTGETGGGGPKQQLTRLEKKALQAFGKISVEGDDEISDHNGHNSPVTIPLDQQEFSSTDSIDPIGILSHENNSNPPLRPTTVRKKKDTLEVLADAFSEHMEESKKRREEDKENNTAMMKALTTAAEGINNLGKAAIILAQKFAKDQ